MWWISTNADTTCPFAFVIVQGGPGDTHPGGVGPGVSQRLADPTGDVIPGLNMLPFWVAPPIEFVWLPSTCSIVTTIGAQLTLGFQEPLAVAPDTASGEGIRDRNMWTGLGGNRKRLSSRLFSLREGSPWTHSTKSPDDRYRMPAGYLSGASTSVEVLSRGWWLSHYRHQKYAFETQQPAIGRRAGYRKLY